MRTTKTTKLILTILTSTIFIAVRAQTFQGTIKPGSTATSIFCAIKPSGNFSDKPTNIMFTIAISQAVGARPALAKITNYYSTFFTKVDLFQQASYGSDYIYLVNMMNPTLTVKNYVANTDDVVAEISFTGNIGNISNIRLVQLPNGTAVGAGIENGNYNFYTDFAVAGDKTNTTSMFYSSTGGTVVNNPLGYSAFSSVSAGSGALPLTWLNFSLQKQNGSALIRWDVANSYNNESFEVEASSDGKTFSSIAKVPASEKTSYSFTDGNAVKMTGSYAYYRIKQVDKDGKTTYSEIKKLLLTGKDFSMLVLGNPIKGNKLNIGIQSPDNNQGLLNIFDLNGKKIFTGNITWTTGYSQQSLDIPFLLSGTYTLHLITALGQFQAKFVK